jgi:type IV/VI secretion system ImpK/VasF family protein
MKLLELVNPILLLVIDLRRKVHAGVPLDFGEVRRKADETFDAVDRKAASAAMTDRWNRATIALCYLMDEIAIMEPWAGKGSWLAHALEIERLGKPDLRRAVLFYDEEYQYALSGGDMEYMEVLYVCMCLGFEGRLRNNPAQLKNHIDNLYARLPIPRGQDEADEKMFTGAYHVDPVKNVPTSMMRVSTVVAFFFAIIASYFLAGFGLHKNLEHDVEKIADTVVQQP